jgi:CheY-like chemotaxis protein
MVLPSPRLLNPNQVGDRFSARLRVLIVEDEVMIAMALETVVLDLGHDVVETVRSEADAVEATALHRPHVVLMDIRLAAGDGVDAARKIRERFAIPAIFMTAHADPETRRRALDVAPVDYLVKPVSQDRLASALARVRVSAEDRS